LTRTTIPLDQFSRLAATPWLYAILDACDEPVVPVKCAELGENQAVSLYRGTTEEKYTSIAPYLVHITPDLLTWITSILWNRPWGTFAYAEAPMAELEKHFRQFLKIERSNGKRAFFRYYDPRVLPTYLERCTNEKASEFYGPVRAFGVNSPGDDKVTFLRNS
jgi:hypothetical protein